MRLPITYPLCSSIHHWAPKTNWRRFSFWAESCSWLLFQNRWSEWRWGSQKELIQVPDEKKKIFSQQKTRCLSGFRWVTVCPSISVLFCFSLLYVSIGNWRLKCWEANTLKNFVLHLVPRISYIKCSKLELFFG